MNDLELEKLAKRTRVPILEVRGYHDKPEKDKDLSAELLADEQFRGLQGTLRLCVGARVLLTQNLWVEAGLMNGALGTVAGFVWPVGGNPTSSESKKRAPLCVIVKFNDVDLGEEPLLDGGFPVVQGGRPVMQRRNFFPELGEAGLGLVPLFREQAASEEGDGIARHQFPLTLAWALTHQKAQGMTLRRVRPMVSKESAGQVGLAYVDATRVKHPWHLIFGQTCRPMRRSRRRSARRTSGRGRGSGWAWR